MSLMNQVVKFTPATANAQAVKREALAAAVIIMSPIAPHVTEALWHKLTGSHLEHAHWPKVDETARQKTLVELAVQVNGKLRGKVEVSPDASEDEARALASEEENVARFLADKNLRKVIYVPGKILNYVVS